MLEVEGANEEEFIESLKDAHAILSCSGGSKVSRKATESLQKCNNAATLFLVYNSVEVSAATGKKYG